MNELIKGLIKLYADNFVLYYKAHSFHFNVQGSTFAQDHAVLEELYTFLWEQHDTIGEQVRQFDKAVPVSLEEVIKLSTLSEQNSLLKVSQPMYDVLCNDIEDTITLAQWVYDKE